MTEFDLAFERTIGIEKGFQADPNDRGNWTGGKIGRGQLKGTKYGISAAAYPDEDIEHLSLDRAKELYRRDYWDRTECDSLPAHVGVQVFDAAVNHGPGNAARMLQRAVKVPDDGLIGPVTLGAVKRRSDTDLIMLFLAERGEFMARISTFSRYGAGWLNRICANLRYGAQDT